MTQPDAGPQQPSTSLNRALTIGAAAWLNDHGVGYYDGATIPASEPWPIYLYEWGRAAQQLVVNVPLLTGDALTYTASLQVLTRADSDDTAERQAALAVDALEPAYMRWGPLVVSRAQLLSISRLGRDQTGRPMWAAKLTLTGNNH